MPPIRMSLAMVDVIHLVIVTRRNVAGMEEIVYFQAFQTAQEFTFYLFTTMVIVTQNFFQKSVNTMEVTASGCLKISPIAA